MNQPRTFRAHFTRNDFGQPTYILKCSQCGTSEYTHGALPHDVAESHSRWWHRGPIIIPQGWSRARNRETPS